MATTNPVRSTSDSARSTQFASKLRAAIASQVGRNPYDTYGQTASSVSSVTMDTGALTTTKTFFPFDAGGFDRFRFRGAPYKSGFAGFTAVNLSNAGGKPAFNVYTGAGTTNESFRGGLVEFKVTAAAMQINVDGFGLSSNYFPMWADDGLGGPFKRVTFTAGAVTGYFVLTFAARGTYRILMGFEQSLKVTSVVLAEDDTLHAVTDTLLPLVIHGDSYTQGTVSPATIGDPCMIGALSMIGGINAIPLGTTDTGWVGTGGGVAYPFTHAERLQRLVDTVNASGARAALVLGGINDLAATAGAIQTQASALIDYFLPRTTSNLILSASQAGILNNGANTQKVDGAVLAAVTAAANPRVKFMPISAAVPPWVSGTRDTAHTSGLIAGNARYVQGNDGIHLSPSFTGFGAEYYARRILDSLVRIAEDAAWF